jgi:hypothetical protein
MFGYDGISSTHITFSNLGEQFLFAKPKHSSDFSAT